MSTVSYLQVFDFCLQTLVLVVTLIKVKQPLRKDLQPLPVTHVPVCGLPDYFFLKPGYLALVMFVVFYLEIQLFTPLR